MIAASVAKRFGLRGTANKVVEKRSRKRVKPRHVGILVFRRRQAIYGCKERVNTAGEGANPRLQWRHDNGVRPGFTNFWAVADGNYDTGLPAGSMVAREAQVKDAEPSNVFESSTSVKDAATITNLVRRLTVG